MAKIWHEPERIEAPGDKRRRRLYFVYVLRTNSGHYVGHTGHLKRRIEQHLAGGVPSTAGTAPSHVWTSKPFFSRDAAARFEAALKTLRDKRRPKFAEITGLQPLPFLRYEYSREVG